MATVPHPATPRKTLADFSLGRRRTALSYIRGEGILTDPRLSPGARLTAVIALLICDDAGHLAQDDLQAAFGDASIVNAARQLLCEAAS